MKAGREARFSFVWWRVRDLNPGPTDYDSAALTTELTRRKSQADYFPIIRRTGAMLAMTLRYATIGLMAAAFATAAAAQTPLRVMLFPGAQNLPMWVAEDKGFFAAEGLAVKLTPTPGSVILIRSILQGEQDIGLAAFDNVVAYQEGAGEV